MKKLVFSAVLAILLGCAHTQPMTEAEMWPEFNKDSQLGLIILEGPASCNLTFRSATTHEKLFSWADRGQNPSFTINGRVFARGYKRKLPKDNYIVEVETFYYANNFFPPVRKRIPLYRYTTYVSVRNNPRAYVEREYTFEDWGWGLRIYTGDIPQYDYQSPTVDIQTTGIATDAVNFVRSLFR